MAVGQRRNSEPRPRRLAGRPSAWEGIPLHTDGSRGSQWPSPTTERASGRSRLRWKGNEYRFRIGHASHRSSDEVSVRGLTARRFDEEQRGRIFGALTGVNEKEELENQTCEILWQAPLTGAGPHRYPGSKAAAYLDRAI